MQKQRNDAYFTTPKIKMNLSMKKIKVFAFTVFLLSAFLVRAQEDYAFRVLANKGANEVKSGDTWQPLKTGTKISDNASVGLVSRNGKPLEVKEAKIHKVVELLSKVGTDISVLNKYTDFILSSNSAEAKKNRLSATGAVHRGLDDIKVFLPDGKLSDVFNTTVIIRWHSEKAVAPYVLSLRNRFNEDLLKIETTENFAMVDLADPKLSKEDMMLLEVKSKTDSKSKSEQFLIKRLSPDRIEAVKADLNKIIVDLKEETAFNKYLLTGFYEDHKLLIDAITCYEQAMKLDAENPTYKEAYEEFLLRNKIKAEK